MMIRKELSFLELTDEHLDPEITPENVVWLSRHALTWEQELAIYYLHGKNVRIERVSNIIFANGKHLVEVIESYSREATVYLVAPPWMINEAIQNSPRLILRYFFGYLESGKFYLLNVREVSATGFKVILWRNELEKHRSLERVRSFIFSG